MRLRERAYAAWRSKSTQDSAFHCDVVEVLSGLGFQLEKEYETPDRAFTLDIAILNVGPVATRIAVEADGPFHFTTTKPYM